HSTCSTKHPVAPMSMTAARLRGNRDCSLLWIGQTLSLVGSQSAWVACPLLVPTLTRSAAKAGIVSFASWIPYVLVLLPVGALVDRGCSRPAACSTESAGAGRSLIAAWMFAI